MVCSPPMWSCPALYIQPREPAAILCAGEEETDCNLGQLIEKGEVAWLQGGKGASAQQAAGAAGWPPVTRELIACLQARPASQLGAWLIVWLCRLGRAGLRLPCCFADPVAVAAGWLTLAL